jgi:hypothetical protein
MSLQNAEIVTRASRLVNASCQSGVAGEELLSLCGPGIRIDASRRVFNPTQNVEAWAIAPFPVRQS